MKNSLLVYTVVMAAMQHGIFFTGSEYPGFPNFYSKSILAKNIIPPVASVKECIRAKMLMVMNRKSFTTKNDYKVYKGMYIIEREYKEGDSLHEVSALIGIPVHKIMRKNWGPILQDIKVHRFESKINGLGDLQFSYHKEYLDHYYDELKKYEKDHNNLLLFVIEPSTPNNKKYLTAHLCFPGGGIEECDKKDIYNCATRELYEETRINIWPDILKRHIVKEVDIDYIGKRKKGKCFKTMLVNLSDIVF